MRNKKNQIMMLKYVTSVLLLTIVVVNGDNFVFPDDISLKSSSRTGYDDGDYENFNSYGNREFGYEGHHPEYSGNYHGNNAGFASGFGNHHGYNNGRDRPWRPNYSGIVSQSQANSQSTGLGSSANSHSSSQGFNEYSQSNAHAQSQGYQEIPSNSFGQHGGSGASSASSAASATSGIINGIPVASAAASAAAASSGGAASSSSSSISSSGFAPGHGQISPWFLRSRSANDNSEGNAIRNDDSSSLNADKIIFSEK